MIAQNVIFKQIGNQTSLNTENINIQVKYLHAAIVNIEQKYPVFWKHMNKLIQKTISRQSLRRRNLAQSVTKSWEMRWL